MGKSMEVPKFLFNIVMSSIVRIIIHKKRIIHWIVKRLGKQKINSVYRIYEKNYIESLS